MTYLQPFVRYLIILLLIATDYLPVSAQHKSKYADSIQNLIVSAEKYMSLHSSNPDSGFLIMKAAEQLAEKSNDIIDKLILLRGKIFLYYTNRDTVKSRKYANEAKKLLIHCNDSLEIALCYEVFGILEPKGSKKAEEYYLKAFRLFSTYGKPENLVDVNFNLAFYYYKIKDWENCLKHSQLGIQAIKQSGKKKERAKFMYVYILDVHNDLQDFERAKEVIVTLDSIRNQPDYNRFTLFEYMYLRGAGRFYSHTNQEKKATQLYTAAFEIIDSLRKMETQRVSGGLLTLNELNIKNEKLKRFEVENKLKKTQIKIGLIVIAFITAVLIFLIFFSLYQRKVSKKTRALNEVLENKNKELETLATELETALSAKTNFLNVMTHELFTPINGIAIITHNLKTETNKECFTQNLELLEFSSNYLYRLLKNMVDTRSIDQDKDLVLNRDATHLKSLIQKITKTAQVFLKTSNNSFQSSVDPDIPDPLQVDSVKLSQILINLLNNANKYTSNGKISLDIKLKEETTDNVLIEFCITDTGIGIDPEFLKIIFDKFKHGSDSIKEKYGGSGIGLYVVKHFLSLHNSEIIVNSQKGKGASFSFSIWFEKVYKDISLPETRTNQKIAGEVLLVDDNKVNLIVTKKLLETKHYHCDTAESGFEAIKKVKEKKYDLILMDIMMPGMNGFETTQKIKQADVQTPVIALTAIDVQQNREDFDRADFAAVITKPFIPNDFFETVKNKINRNP